MSKSNPRVSVIMPVFNGEKFLCKAVDSILLQTYKDFEFIIIDDGSKDESQRIIKEYSDSRIKLYVNEVNQGIVNTLNKGLSKAKGKYIARMDCDDISLPHRFEKQVEFLDKNENIGILGSYVKIVDKNLKALPTTLKPISNLQIKWKLLYDCPIMHPSVMFRKILIDKYGKYSFRFPHAEDYELWSRLTNYVEFHNLRDELILLRQHSENIGKVYNVVQIQSHVSIASENITKILNWDKSFAINQFLINIIRDKTIDRDILDHLIIIKELFYSFKRKWTLSKKDKQWIINDISRLHLILFSKCKHNQRIQFISFFIKQLVYMKIFYYEILFYSIKILISYTQEKNSKIIWDLQ
ncbi:MAG: glycosyltransferase [Candidatus Helarchaeota archaeon]